jgi:diaminohydroxyphosphoribosylaminopyrimidine deaminase/5-amino-6-(5-phosphoribosylamino)uracil reductase
VLQPRRVVVDSSFATPPSARLLEAPAEVWVVGARDDASDREALLRERGARTLRLPGADGRVDLAALIGELGRHGVNELHVEAGARLNGALLHAGLVDELLLYLAPKLLGPGRDVAHLPVLPGLDAATRWHFIDTAMLGADLRVRAMRDDALNFLA